MKILGIDYGKKRLGLALYDPAVRVVVPFGLKELTRDFESELRLLVAREQIGRIIIGLPLNLAGQENTQTHAVRIFGNQLVELLNIPIEFFDERFTSVAADRFDIGVSRDEKAAVFILEGWLERQRLGQIV